MPNYKIVYEYTLNWILKFHQKENKNKKNWLLSKIVIKTNRPTFPKSVSNKKNFIYQNHKVYLNYNYFFFKLPEMIMFWAHRNCSHLLYVDFFPFICVTMALFSLAAAPRYSSFMCKFQMLIRISSYLAILI